MANLFWISAAQVVTDLGDGPHSAATLLARYGWTFARADGSTCATYIDKNGLVQTAAANTLRVQYEDLDGDGVRESPGLLLEGSRQNLFLQSEVFGTSWTLFDVTVSSNADTAPDGTVTADRLVEDSSVGAEHVAYQSPTATADVRHSLSVFAKAGTRTWAVMTIRDNAGMANGVHAYFNLSAGTVGTVGHTGAGSGEYAAIVKLANGWYRCILVGACNNGDTTPLGTVGLATGDGGRIYTGDGASYISVWGGQFENNAAFPSSYIKTVASAVTRAADSFTLPFNFGPFDTTILGRLARPIWADASGDIGAFPSLCNVSTANPRYELFFDEFTRTFSARSNGAATQANASLLAGAQLTLLSQHKNAATLPAAAVDVGSGLTAFDTGAAAFTAFANQTLQVGVSAPLYGVLLDLKGRPGLVTWAAMQVEPSFAPIGPFEVSDLDSPGPLISKAQSGRVNRRATQQVGFTWTEHYLLKVTDATHRECRARLDQYWANGTIFAKGHVDYAAPKGVGGGFPLVKGASQTGSTLIVDGCPLNTANWLRAGDIFRVQGLPRTFMVAADVNTEGDGRALIPLTRPIFTGGSPSDNATLTITGVTLDVVLLEPPTFPTTSGTGADYGELIIKLSEAL